MLRATIEIVPFGIETGKREIAVVEVANINGDEVVADYACRLIKDGDVKAWAYVHNHLRSDGAEWLIACAISALRGDDYEPNS